MSRKKYIVIKAGTLEMPILFSELQSHVEVAAAFGHPVLGAGFWGEDTEGRFVCYGKSVSLQIESRPEEDAAVMNRLFIGY